MDTYPQMFFVRDCAELIPAWLKAPVPGLQFLDSSIPFLSVLDSRLFQWNRMGGEVEDLEDEWKREEEDEDLEWEEIVEQALEGELEEDLEEESPEREISEPEVSAPEVSEPVRPEAAASSSSAVSFYIEGNVGYGIRTRYAIKGEEFAVDENTIVSGTLVHGAYAAVQGYVDEKGISRATIVVSDAYRLH